MWTMKSLGKPITQRMEGENRVISGKELYKLLKIKQKSEAVNFPETLVSVFISSTSLGRTGLGSSWGVFKLHMRNFVSGFPGIHGLLNAFWAPKGEKKKKLIQG